MAGLNIATVWTDSLYRARSMGWQYLLGTALLLLSIALIFLGLLPRSDLLEQLRHQVAIQEIHRDKKSPPIDNSPQAVLNTFYKLLPTEEQAPKAFQQILIMANDQGLEPEKSEYLATRNASAAFTRYQMILPMHGRYVDIQQFITHVLNALPNAALSEISFKRDEANPSQVVALLRFSIYTGSEVL